MSKSNETLEAILLEMKSKLEEIHQQTIRTNGRVGSLERWRAYITGGLTIIGIVVGFVVNKLF